MFRKRAALSGTAGTETETPRGGGRKRGFVTVTASKGRRQKVNSRAKGIAGELAACRAMEGITRVRWERTAQRWGNATSDIWAPACTGMPVHVEVKFHAEGLKRFTVAATESSLNLTRDDLLFCRLDRWKEVLGSGRIPSLVGVNNRVSKFMSQASSDAAPQTTPFLLMRMNHCPWIVCWRNRDDRQLGLIMGFYWGAYQERCETCVASP